MARDKPITIEKLSENQDSWEFWRQLHAEVNLAHFQERFVAGAERTSSSLDFKVAYFDGLKEVRYSLEQFRLIYDGHEYDIIGYDDYFERHIEVVLMGALHG